MVPVMRRHNAPDVTAHTFASIVSGNSDVIRIVSRPTVEDTFERLDQADTFVEEFQMLAKTKDPWSQSIHLLKMLSEAKMRADGSSLTGAWAARRAECAEHPPHHASVRVLDRPSPTTVTIAWLDSTSCRYGNQVWRSCVARGVGTCAVSGWQIQPGDLVYKPRACRPMPSNADAMILATVVCNAVEV